MAYIHIPTLTERTPQQIMEENPNTAFPNGAWSDEMLADFGYAELHYPSEHPQPANRWERLVERTPAQGADGRWYKTIEVESMLPGEDQPEARAKFLADEKTALRAECARIRYQREVLGISLNGAQIKTDRESQATITAAVTAAQRNPNIVIDWKGADGWVQITAAEVLAMGDAVINYVQSLFSAERAHHAAIAALTDPVAIRDYDVFVGWPAQQNAEASQP